MNKRIETKYILNKKQFNFLSIHLPTILKKDKFSLIDGYPVTSLYFDDPFYKAFFDKEEGELMKEKWRLRIYNHDLSTLHLEKKIKEGRVSYKEIFSSPHEHGLQPKILVHYQRLAFEDSDVRVTLDFNLSFDKARIQSDIENEQKHEISSEVLLLEVKLNLGSAHSHLDQLIKKLNLKSSAFSKYHEGMRLLYGL